MHISLFTLLMTFIWSSFLIVFFYLLRKKLFIVEACSVNGIVAIYLFIAVRLLLPVEFPWTLEVNGGIVWKQIEQFTAYKIEYSGRNFFTVSQLFLAIWILVAVYRLSKIAVNYYKLSTFAKTVPSFQLDNFVALERGISVKVTDEVKAPCAIGIINKAILLPEKDYSLKEIKYILMHEMTHHENHDLLIKLFTSVLCAIYWWNPFVVFLKKDLNQSLEIRCDRKVIRNFDNDEKADYLEVILKEFKSTLGPVSKSNECLMELSNSNENELVERFKLVATEDLAMVNWKKFVVFITVTFAFICSYAFVFQPYFEPPMEELDGDDYYFDQNDSYIMQDKDGSYYMVTPREKIIIDEGQVDFFCNDGFEVREK